MCMAQLFRNTYFDSLIHTCKPQPCQLSEGWQLSTTSCVLVNYWIIRETSRRKRLHHICKSRSTKSYRLHAQIRASIAYMSHQLSVRSLSNAKLQSKAKQRSIDLCLSSAQVPSARPGSFLAKPHLMMITLVLFSGTPFSLYSYLSSL